MIDEASPSPAPARGVPAATVLIAAPNDTASTSSLMVYIMMDVRKKYGMLAHMAGKKDITEASFPYHVDNAWWDNPLVVFADATLAETDARGGADSEAIVGDAKSANVTVRAALIPHAALAVDSLTDSDAIKATITVDIGAVADYYDSKWVRMVYVKDRRVTFVIDTCDPLRQVEEVGRETRTLPVFGYERYTRDHTRWDARALWPAKAVNGDWRAVISGTDAVLNVRAYRYASPPPMEVAQQ
jgi:hypothetical protein